MTSTTSRDVANRTFLPTRIHKNLDQKFDTGHSKLTVLDAHPHTMPNSIESCVKQLAKLNEEQSTLAGQIEELESQLVDEHSEVHTRVLQLRARFEQLLVFGASIFQEILTAIREEETLESKLKVGKHLMTEWLKARKNVMYSFKTLDKLGYSTSPFFRKSYIEHCQEAMYYLHPPEHIVPDVLSP